MCMYVFLMTTPVSRRETDARKGQSKELRLVSLTPKPETLITALHVGSVKTVSLEIH